MYSQNRSTSGPLLHPSPQSKMHYNDVHGRKRSAETALDDPTSLEPRHLKSPTPPSGHPHPQQPHALPPPSIPSNEHQPRKVLAPGATKAAIARLSALKAQERGMSPPSEQQATIPTAHAPPGQASRPKSKPKPQPVNAKPTTTPTPTAAPSGTKVLAPGATQAALARLGGMGAVSNVAPSSFPPNQVKNPFVTVAAIQQQHHHHTSTTAIAGPKKVLAPGATQAALARLASLKSSSSTPNHHQQDQQHHAVVLPPPPHPLFNSNGGAGVVVGSGGVNNNAVPASRPAVFTPTAADFSNGTIVWAKMLSYPWWPAQIQQPSPDQMRLRHSSSDIFIVFYGTADYSWLPRSELRLFRTNLPEYSKFAGPRNKALQRAIDEAWVSLGQPRPDVFGKMVSQIIPPVGNYY